jgi:hypothetical protein
MVFAFITGFFTNLLDKIRTWWDPPKPKIKQLRPFKNWAASAPIN